MIPQLKTPRSLDIDLLTKMMGDYYKEVGMQFDPSKAKKAFRELLQSPSLAKVWLIEADKTIVGYVVLTLSLSMEFFGLTGMIDDLYIAKPFRGRGIGKNVLNQVEEKAKKLRLTSLLLEASERTGAKRFYENSGFSTRDHLYLMEKPLCETSHA